MSSVTFETRIGVEAEKVFVMATFDADDGIETMTVSPVIEGRVQIDISGYLDKSTIPRLQAEARKALRDQVEQARADAAIERYEADLSWAATEAERLAA